MSLSKKTRRNLATFNHLKYNTKQVVYNVKRIDLEADLNTYIKAFQEVQSDAQTISETR